MGKGEQNLEGKQNLFFLDLKTKATLGHFYPFLT